jgi:hypothetical protein
MSQVLSTRTSWCSMTEQFTRASVSRGRDMAMESKCGQMAPSLKDIGKTMWLTAEANSSILMEIFMMVSTDTIIIGSLFQII